MALLPRSRGEDDVDLILRRFGLQSVQVETFDLKGDGFVEGICDQLQRIKRNFFPVDMPLKEKARDLRGKITQYLKKCLSMKKINWKKTMTLSVDQWIEKMQK